MPRCTNGRGQWRLIHEAAPTGDVTGRMPFEADQATPGTDEMGQHDRVVVTRNGRPAAVIRSPEDLAQLEETRSSYEIVLTPPARRAVVDGLPQAEAAAVSEFITTALLEDPQRVGRPLRGDVSGVWSARRGTHRVLYRIQEQSREVVVLRIEHRRDVFCGTS